MLALLDVVVQAGKPAAAAAAGAVKPSPTTVADLLAGIDASAKANVIPEKLAGALRALIADAGDDMEKVKANVQEWFDGSMDRVAGWYKRRAQFVLIIIGVCVAVGINADTLTVVQTLSNDAAVRSAVVAAAEVYARENPRDVSGDAGGGGANTGGAGSGASSASGQGSEVTTKMQQEVKSTVEQLSVLGLPIGWRYFEPTQDRCGNIADPDGRRQCLIDQRVWPQWSARTGAQWFDDWWNQLASHLLGWLLTAFAISLGAPFWFDLLNKVMVIRSTVKPHEKSQEEGSEDRQRATASQTVRVEIAQAKP